MKTWSFRARTAALITALPALAFFPGCLSDDDNSPESDTLDDAQNSVATELGESLLEWDQEMVSAIPGWMENGFEGPTLREQQVTWNAEQETWVIVTGETYEEEYVSGQIYATHNVQFLTGGVPVQYPAPGAADEIRVDIEGTNGGTYQPSDAYHVNFNLTLARSIVAVRNVDGSIHWTGEGVFGGSTEYHVGERVYPRQMTWTWSSDLSWDEGSTCAEGTVTGSTLRADLLATFDGAGNIAWQVTLDSGAVRTGVRTYECSVPPPAE